MHTLAPEIREKLYANVGGQFEQAAAVIVTSRKPPAAKVETLKDLVKLAYQSGLDRGYDLGHAVFSNDAE